MVLLLCGLTAGRAGAQDVHLVDSLKSALDKANKAQRFEIYYSLFRETRTSNQEDALEYAQKALVQAKENGDSLAIIKAAHAHGYMLRTMGNYYDAIADFQYALGIGKRANTVDSLKERYNDQVMFIINSLALAYGSKGNYDEALRYHFESLKIREKKGDPLDISVAFNNIGSVYGDLGDDENALAYYQKTYNIKVENNITHDLDLALLNLGATLGRLGKYAEAESKIREAFPMIDTVKNQGIQAQANYSLGVTLMNQKRYEEAEKNLRIASGLFKKLGFNDDVSLTLSSLAKLRYEQKRMDEALYLLSQSQENATRKLMTENYLLYSKIYSDLGDFKQASHYQDLYIKLDKEIFSADLIRNIARIQTSYEERKNIQTIAEKDEILMLNEKSIQQQKMANVLLIIIIVLFSALVIVIFRNYQKIKSVNEALATAKRMIEVQNRLLDKQVQEKTKELVDTNEALTKVNDELDNFIYKTSHDIRGPLASLKGMVNLAIMDVNDEKAIGYLQKLDLTAEKLNMVLTRLLIVNRINHAELKPEVVHFEPIIQEILTLEVKKGVPAKIRVEYEVDHDIQLVSDKEMVRLVLENLIDNAIKFYNESERVESFVKIVVERDGSNIVARVMDNGVGVAQMNREKIFQMFVRASERSETGGIGLYLAKLATEKLGGEINLFSTDEKFTEFTVRFPNDLPAILERRKEERRKHDEEKVQWSSQTKTAHSA